MEKKSEKDLIIPFYILIDAAASSTSKILMSIIHAGTKHKKCLFNNEFLGGPTSLTKTSCSNLIMLLKKNKYLEDSRANNSKLCNKNKHRHTGYMRELTSARDLYLITNDFDEKLIAEKFRKDKEANIKLVKNIIKLYDYLDFKKTEIVVKDYLLIFRACSLFGKDDIIKALYFMSKSSLAKEHLDLHSIFKVSFIRNALGEKIDLYIKNIINFKEGLKEEDMIL